MKFGYKIFLMSFTLIVITINVIGIIMINNTFKSNIENEIDKNIVEINNIMNSIYLNSGDLPYIASTYLLDEVNTKIYLNENIIFTNFKENKIEIENKIIEKLEDKINTYIENNILYMALKKNNYIVITASNIEEVYQNKDNQINYFIKLSLICSLLIAFVLSILVSFITRKLKKLKKAVTEIEKGNYEVAIPKLGSDEIGMFAASFKSMTSSIHKNIQEIEEISENRKIFIGNLTHEIRTPLTSIIGYSSLIKSGNVKDLNTIYSYNKKIYEEGKYIEKLRDKLMHLLTLENDKIELITSNISNELNHILNEIKTIYPDAIILKEIKPNVIKDIDAALFKSLIFNLVKNSFKASKIPKIKITLTENELIILDNGRGIPKKELAKVIEPFYTLNKDRNREHSNMGLGLPLCIQIVKVHHWQMKIKSKEFVGTEIDIKIGEEK